MDVKSGVLDVTGENFAWLSNRTLSSSWNKAEGIDVESFAAIVYSCVESRNIRIKLSESISSCIIIQHMPEVYTTDK